MKTRLLPVIVVATATLVIGCGREAPPALAPVMAAKVADVAEVNTPRGFVDSIALARDVGHVATGERGGRIRVWAPAGTEEPINLQYRQAIVDLAFSPSGDLLASLGRHGEGALRLWQPAERAGAKVWAEVAAVPMGRCLALRFDGSGTRLAVMCEREVLLLGDGRLLAPTGDRRGMRLFDVSRKTSRVVASGGKAYHAVAITDDATGFAAITSDLASGTLTYGVEIWRLPAAPSG